MFASSSSTRSADRKHSIYDKRRMTFKAVLIYFFLILLHDCDGYVVAKITNGSVDATVSVVPTVTELHTEKALNQLHVNKNLTNHNDMKTALNEGSFASLTNDSLIIVVQVHTRVTYLGFLIGSLGQSSDIGKVLLIFSHDYYDADINDLVKSIKFCRVVQIFYPYPVHWHPKCPQDTEESSNKCNMAEFSEHGKRTVLAQMKHHWWWKTNYVFDQLEITRYYTGLVLFLEEDHYVAEDFLYVLEMMYKRSTQLCRKCNILSLGTYFEASDNYTYDGEVEVMPWISSKHNMGFAFNRTTWNSIRKCAKHFCSYDDYNWDWSLQHVSQQCLRRKLHAMIVKGPRVFHIGECGVHHKKKNCESNQVISKVQQVLRIARKSGQMFPRTLTLTVASLIKKTKLRKGNGGWGDKRDHELCMNMTLPVR